jgi:uncharacterized Fe-S cluster-containing radical SAM superfamily protein
MPLDTEEISERFRNAALNLQGKKLLVTNFIGTDQEKDFSEPANCKGFGRVRHFRRATSAGWPNNPLPIDPACRALGLPQADVVRAQAFQNAVCNWRCWYCFVPFELLRANKHHSDWMTSEQLLDLYLATEDRPTVIDLTGGQPDLTPEWVPWMMRAINKRNLQNSIYLWSDDNLSNDYFWRYLSSEDHDLIAAFKNYGRVACFKGFDADSFAFNTKAPGELFERQFELMRRFIEFGIDLYGYVTLTSPSSDLIRDKVRTFIDRLQGLDEFLPLRIIPLEIQVFSPVEPRLNVLARNSLTYQWQAIEEWNRQLSDRFSCGLRSMNIFDVPLASRRGGCERRR